MVTFIEVPSDIRTSDSANITEKISANSRMVSSKISISSVRETVDGEFESKASISRSENVVLKSTSGVAAEKEQNLCA